MCERGSPECLLGTAAIVPPLCGMWLVILLLEVLEVEGIGWGLCSCFGNISRLRGSFPLTLLLAPCGKSGENPAAF